MQWGRGPVVFLVAVVAVGVGVWRLVRAIDNVGTSTNQTFTLLTPAPDPACAVPENSYQSACNTNPCNPTTVYYQPTNPGCQPSVLPVTTTSPGAPPPRRSRKRRPRGNAGKKPVPTGPVSPGTLGKSVGKQLILFARVKPDLLVCPPLPRRRGAAVTCRVRGRSLDDGMAAARGTARVTMSDRAGDNASVRYLFSVAGGIEIRGSGYPFDPDTGRVL